MSLASISAVIYCNSSRSCVSQIFAQAQNGQGHNSEVSNGLLLHHCSPTQAAGSRNLNVENSCTLSWLRFQINKQVSHLLASGIHVRAFEFHLRATSVENRHVHSIIACINFSATSWLLNVGSRGRGKPRRRGTGLAWAPGTSHPPALLSVSSSS